MCHYLFSLITFPVALPAPPSLITSLVWSMLNMAELGKALPPRLSAGIHYSPRSSHRALSAGPGATPRSRHSRAFRPGLGSDRPVPLSHRCCSARARRSVSLPLSPVLFLWPRSPIYIRRGRSWTLRVYSLSVPAGTRAVTARSPRGPRAVGSPCPSGAEGCSASRLPPALLPGCAAVPAERRLPRRIYTACALSMHCVDQFQCRWKPPALPCFGVLRLSDFCAVWSAAYCSISAPCKQECRVFEAWSLTAVRQH